jgi:rRNA maturation endonuclease Nob1
MILTKQQLLDLQEEIAEAKTATSELKGQQTAILKQFKEDHGSSTVEEAEEKKETLDRSLSSLDKKIKKYATELEEQLEGKEEEEE